MENIYRPIRQENIEKFVDEANKVTIDLQKDLTALLGGGYSIKEMTPVIDTALDCIDTWNGNIHMDGYLTKYDSPIGMIPGVESRLYWCENNMYYLRTEFERLKNDEYYYDAKYSVPLQEAPLSPPPKDYFRQRSRKWGNHGPYTYCLEYKDKVFSSEEISKTIQVKDLWIGMDSWKEAFVLGQDNFYKIHTCVQIDFKESMSLAEVKEAYPGAKVYHGTKAHQFYKKYIRPGFGPVYTCKLMNRNRWSNEVVTGQISFLESEPK